MHLRSGLIGVVALGLLLGTATGAQAAAPACTAPSAQTTPYGNTLYLYGPHYCTDADGDALTFDIVTPPAHGTVTGAIADGELEYSPAHGFSGADSFTFKARDATTDSNVVTVEITVAANQPPQCSEDFSFEAEPGQVTNFNPTDYYSDEETPVCSDPEYADLTFKLAGPPAHGTVSAYEAGTGFSYRPTAGYAGPDSFTFRASDDDADSALVTVRITVLKPNHAPSCVSPLTLRTEPGQSVVLGPLNHLVSCSDPDGDPLWPTLVSGPSHGTLSVDSVLSYVPNPGFEGTDEIRYSVEDSRGASSNVATVLIIVARPTTSVASQPTDTRAPVVRVQPARHQNLATLRRRGLKLILHSSEACQVNAAITVDRRAARALGLRSRRLGSAVRTVPAGRAIVVVKLTPKARKAIRHAKKLRIRVTMTATDAHGNHRTRTLGLTIRR